MRPSRWASSSRAKGAASTGARRRPRCRPHGAWRYAARSVSPRLIVSFNTPLPNYAWKAFPAVFCGNAAVLKPSEHTPRPPRSSPSSATSFFRRACSTSCTGSAPRQGPPLVEHADVDLVSFTGSAETGRWIAERARAPAREGRASSSAGRTRWSSATTPISIVPSSGRSRRRSPMRASAVPRRVASSCSIRSTTSSENGSWQERAPTRRAR